MGGEYEANHAPRGTVWPSPLQTANDATGGGGTYELGHQHPTDGKGDDTFDPRGPHSETGNEAAFVSKSPNDATPMQQASSEYEFPPFQATARRGSTASTASSESNGYAELDTTLQLDPNAMLEVIQKKFDPLRY